MTYNLYFTNKLPEAQNTKQQSEVGVALIELSIALGLLMTFVAGSISLTITLSELSIAAEAARHAARATAAQIHNSGGSSLCSETSSTLNCHDTASPHNILDQGNLLACHYLTSSGIINDNWSFTASVIDLNEELFSNKAVRVSATTLNNNCIFCWGHTFDGLQLQASGTFLIEGGC